MPSSKLEDYEVIATIGSGAYGTCQRIKRISDGKVLVWKQMDYGEMSDSEKQMLVSEVNTLKELKHKNIVKYFDRIIDRENMKLFIIMEFCEGGDLASLISKCRKERKYLEVNFIWKVYIQLLQALQECHKRRGGRVILHRDLKPANVFLDSGHNVKLGDFGLARALAHDSSFAKTYVGTPYYMSPEQMNYLHYNEKSDVWSLGCLIYELCALIPPFTASNKDMLALKIRDGKFKRIPQQFTSDLNDVITSMLVAKPELRPTIDSLLQDPVADSKMISLKLNPTPNTGGRDPSDRRNTPTTGVTPSRADDTRQREEALRVKEASLQQKERLLTARERSVAIREQLVEDKMKRADSLMKEYNMKLAGVDHIKEGMSISKDPVVLSEVFNKKIPTNKSTLMPLNTHRLSAQRKKDLLSPERERNQPKLSQVKLPPIKKPSPSCYDETYQALKQLDNIDNSSQCVHLSNPKDYHRHLKRRLEKAKMKSTILRDVAVNSQVWSNTVMSVC